MKKMYSSFIVLIFVFSGYKSLFSQDNDEHKNISKFVNNKGEIFFPKDFRTSMVHLGSWFVPKGEASGFHGVFTQPKSLKAFQETGKFPDGTVIVKELRASKPGNFTTGENVQHETQVIKQWFVMVKDGKNRFAKNNKNWGDGWGWALFKPDTPFKNVSTNYKIDCIGCHIPAKDSDWIYVDSYPILFEKNKQ